MASVLTSLGREWVVDRLVGVSGQYSTDLGNFAGWGTGAGTANTTDTTLFTESNDPVSSARTTSGGAITKQGSGSTSKWQYIITIPSTSTQTITNAGLFKAGGAASMFVKGDFTGIALASGDSIQFTYSLTPS